MLEPCCKECLYKGALLFNVFVGIVPLKQIEYGVLVYGDFYSNMPKAIFYLQVYIGLLGKIGE